MRIIKPSVEIISPEKGGDILKHIERCGRVCYKSEDKITADSAEKFVAGIIKRGHEAVLEHGSFIFKASFDAFHDLKKARSLLEGKHGFRCYLRFTRDKGRFIVSGNVRAWRDFLKACVMWVYSAPEYMASFIRENKVLFPEYQNIDYYAVECGTICPMKKAELRPGVEQLIHWDETVHFICDRGVSHEIVRHRDAGLCQESTRYCNYGKDGFGNEITVIEPLYLTKNSPRWHMWRTSCETAEEYYMAMLESGCTPQEARAVLPNSLNTEVVMTANLREWRHFLRLRTNNAAHPQMREVALMLLEQMKEKIPVVFDDIKEE